MKNLIQKTSYFREPYYFSNDDNEINYLSRCLVELLQLFTNANINLNRYIRFYRNGSLENVDRFRQLLKNSKIETFEDIEKTFNENNNTTFSIVINRTEELSTELSYYVTKKFKENSNYFSNNDILLESTYFISNYTYTPFGIHIDDISNALHFNLTSKSREMILWENKYFEGINLEKVEEIQCVEKYGKSYIIDNQKSFFLPAQTYYHVGKNKGFNISFAVAFIKYPTKELLKRVIEHNSDYISENYTISKNEVIDTQFLYKKYQMKYESNNYLRGIATKNESAFEISDNMKFKKYAEFKIIWCKDKNGNIFIFIRGHELVLKYNIIYELIFEYINSNDVISVVNLRDSISKNIPDDTYIAILQLLYKYNFIEVSND